jgi:hypothetical protein
MASRLKLHEELCEILGTRNVYFQPPESIKMQYPAIRYSRSAPDVKRANNQIYSNTNKYEVTVIDEDPDSDIPDKICAHFRMCGFDRWYPADNLNHFTLTLYY